MPPASQTSNLSVFAGATGVYTGIKGGRNLGFTAGGDLAIRGFFGLRPAVEVRGTYPVDDGRIDYQKHIEGGVRVERPIRRFHPYGDFLIGRGQINYVLADPTPYLYLFDGVFAGLRDRVRSDASLRRARRLAGSALDTPV